MLRGTTTVRKREKRKRRVQFPGICTHAALLGVSRVHLWQVLSGRRVSGSLMQRYLELKRKEAA